MRAAAEPLAETGVGAPAVVVRTDAHLPSAEQARARLDYDPATGVLTWKTTPLENGSWNRWAGRTAGAVNAAGYLKVMFRDRPIMAHRLAWLIHYGELPPPFLDHINCVRTDNRIANLRPASRTENNRNGGMRKNNTFGFKGVCFCTQTGRWQAAITVDRRSIRLGRFDTPEEAHEAYRAAAERYHGPFARTK